MALLTIITQTGIGITTLPSVLAKEVGHDGWISLLVTGILAVILSACIAQLLKRYSDKNIFDIGRLIFGKAVGAFFNILLILYLVSAAAAGIRIFSAFLRLTLLPLTPSLVLTPFILLPTAYLIWQGLKPICRFKYVTIASHAAVLLLIILLIPNLKLSFLMPVGEAGMTSILYSMKTSFFAFVGLELIVFFYPEITDNKDTMKWHMLSSVVSTLILLIIVAASTALFGENLIKILSIPLFNLMRVYNAPIFERVDLYLIASWYVAMDSSIRSYIFASFYSLQKVFGLRKSKTLLILVMASMIMLSRIPQDINASFMFLEIINYAGMGVSVYLIICLCLSFIKKKGVKAR